MMGQNYYGYQPYNPYQRQQEVVKVNGKNGVMAYQLPPNSSALLLDTNAPIVWLKTTDGASYPTITGYTITPLVEEQPVQIEQNDYKKLEERIDRLERLLGDGESDSTNTKQTHKQSSPTK